MKKRYKILGGTLLFLLGLLLLVPMYLENRIEPILRRQVNTAIRGTFDFDQAELSLIRNFPNARVSLRDLYVTTEAPFEGDTLLKASRLTLVMSVWELFKKEGEPIAIKNIQIEKGDLRLVSDAEERVNYLIARSDPEVTDPDSGTNGTPVSGGAGASENFTFSLESYEILDSRISYRDLAARYTFWLEEIGHEGSGDLSLIQSELDTHTQARISFEMDSTVYLDRNELVWDALLGIDLETDTYTLKENEGRINQLPLKLDGFVRLLEEGQEFDLHLLTPDSDFRNLLGLMPEALAGNLDGVSASGRFNAEGEVTGIWDETRIPAFELRILGSDGAFQYQGMPLGMEDIQLEGTLKNTSGLATETTLELPRASFRLDGEPFAVKGSARDLGGNAKVDAEVEGTLDLGSLSRVLPQLKGTGIRGRINAKLSAAFDQRALAEERYRDTRSSGQLTISGLSYPSEALSDTLKIARASLRFDPARARLESLSGTLGQSDFQLQGTLENVMGYAFGDGILHGQLQMRSNRFDLSDFRTPEAGSAPEATQGEKTNGGTSNEAFMLPENLDLTAQMTANTLIYDKLKMSDMVGQLQLSDQQLKLSGLRSQALDGTLALDGSIVTRGAAPRFELDLGIEGFRIAETLETIELMQTLVPIAGLLEGAFNTRLRISGALKEDFSPDLMSLTGRAVAEVQSAGLSGRKGAVLEALDNRLDFFDAGALDLSGLKTVLAFEEGLVAVSPFSFRYRDIEVTVSGGHTFDQQLDYRATFEVPAKYLGSEVGKALASMQDPELRELTVPVTASITGRYQAPEVGTDLKAVAGNLASRLVEMQKQRLLAGGKEKARDLLGDLLDKRPDTSQVDSAGAGGGLRDLLRGVTGEKPNRSSDTIRSADQPLEKTARGILGGLIRNRRDTTAKKTNTTSIARDTTATGSDTIPRQ